ncbi:MULTISPECIES: DUF4189 domain-containing protein [unclassified Rhizobium]|uniref:DUF4189 domain-containing protein n=1 Tax=unclassified Rhizobium TaxID=2613769 RepID=UPI00382824E9
MTSMRFTALISALAITFTTGAASAAQFGAIAYSKSSGSYGSSHNYSTRADAEDEALSGCSSYADDCRVVVYFRNACGALATGNNHGYGYGWSERRARAQYTALSNCAANDSGCHIVSWTCSK